MGEPVSLVLVGIGGYGQSYLNGLLDELGLDGVEISGAVDPSPEHCSRMDDLKALGVPVYGALDEFYARHCAELAVVSSPIQYHCPQTCLALEHGSHVLCEKPLSATVQEAERMATARDAAGRFVAIGYQWSFSDAIRGLKADISRGRFGAPVRMKTMALWPRNYAYYARNSWAGALKDRNGNWVLDSPVNNATAHYLHNMFFCLGDRWNASKRPVEVTGELYRANDITNYDTAVLRCRTQSGVEILYACSHATQRQIGPVLVYEFEEATVTVEEGGADFVVRFADGRQTTYPNPYNGPRKKLEQCLAAVRSGVEVACPIEAGLSQTICMNGLQESADGILDFPGELLRGQDGDRRWVEGLEEALTGCYEKWSLPAEVGVDWARPGRTIDLVSYRHFPQCGDGD